MRCSRCGAEMRVKNVKVDTDIYGNPIYNKYAYCYNCKIKRNLGQEKGSAGRNSRKLSSKKARQRKRKKLLIAAIAVFILAVICGIAVFTLSRQKTDSTPKENAIVTDSHKNKITAKIFSKLETGMSLNEIKDLIGNDGNRLMQFTVSDLKTERYQWVSEDGSGVVILTFEDQKLISISQVNMIYSEPVTLSADTVKKIKFEMTYDNVVKELSAEGTLMSETLADGVTNTIYTWYDEESNIRVTVVFQDGKVISIS